MQQHPAQAGVLDREVRRVLGQPLEVAEDPLVPEHFTRPDVDRRHPVGPPDHEDPALRVELRAGHHPALDVQVVGQVEVTGQIRLPAEPARVEVDQGGPTGRQDGQAAVDRLHDSSPGHPSAQPADHPAPRILQHQPRPDPSHRAAVRVDHRQRVRTVTQDGASGAYVDVGARQGVLGSVIEDEGLPVDVVDLVVGPVGPEHPAVGIDHAVDLRARRRRSPRGGELEEHELLVAELDALPPGLVGLRHPSRVLDRHLDTSTVRVEDADDRTLSVEPVDGTLAAGLHLVRVVDRVEVAGPGEVERVARRAAAAGDAQGEGEERHGSDPVTTAETWHGDTVPTVTRDQTAQRSSASSSSARRRRSSGSAAPTTRVDRPPTTKS